MTLVRNAEFGVRSELKERTKPFAIQVIKLIEELPKSRIADILGTQLLRAGTSVGANYRAACRARSKADFIAKMGIVEEEADEARYWLELLVEAAVVIPVRVQSLLEECDEILAMTVASIRTARSTR